MCFAVHYSSAQQGNYASSYRQAYSAVTYSSYHLLNTYKNITESKKQQHAGIQKPK